MPPRPAIRAIRTMSYCAMRSDCCMSATLVCTRVSLLLKSNSSRIPRTTTTVTASATRSSIRVKPFWPAVRVAQSRRGFIGSSSIGLENRQGDLLAAAQGAAGAAALYVDLDLPGMDGGHRGPGGEGVSQLAAGEHAGKAVLADRHRAGPERHFAGGERIDPGMSRLREILYGHRLVSRRDLQIGAAQRQRVQALELGLGIVRRLGEVGARAVVGDRLGEEGHEAQGDDQEDGRRDQHLDEREPL